MFTCSEIVLWFIIVMRTLCDYSSQEADDTSELDLSLGEDDDENKVVFVKDRPMIYGHIPGLWIWWWALL